MSILFATPMYGGMCHERHFNSCIQLKEQLELGKVDHGWLTGAKESLVHRGRMVMTADFLQKTDFSHMMWLDGDIEHKPEDVGKLWNLCGEKDVDVAVGVYAMKKKDEQWYAAWKDGKLVKDLDQFKEPITVDYAGTGFMLISRKCLLGVYEYLKKRHARTLKLLSQITPSDDADKKLIREMGQMMAADWEHDEGLRVPALYMTPIYDDGLESEDYHFCRIAQEAGFKVWMDPSVRLIHWGQFGYGA